MAAIFLCLLNHTTLGATLETSPLVRLILKLQSVGSSAVLIVVLFVWHCVECPVFKPVSRCLGP